jgi:hypothetical protein
MIMAGSFGPRVKTPTRAPILALTLCLAARAWAAGAAPTVVAAPIDVPRAPSREVVNDLNRYLRAQLMRDPAVVTPTPSLWDAAIAQEKRQDCDVSDDCLQQLAVLAGTVYAVFASVELDLTRTKVTAVGRVVRRDGVLVEMGGEHGLRVEIDRQDRPFEAVAKEALGRLIAAMKLGTLVPTVPAADVAQARPKPAPQPVAAPTPPPPAAASPPPPAVTAESRSGMHTVGTVTLIAGAVLAVTGGVLFGVGQQQAGTLTPVSGNLPSSQVGAYHLATTLRPVGAAVAGVGLAAVVTGLLLWLVGPSAPAPVALMLRHEGARSWW